MRKIFAKIIVAMLLVFFGIAVANASYTVIPVKQYGMLENSTYSDWYYQNRNELAKEDNGPLYGSQYQKHMSLWLLVEGMTPSDINHNTKKILTVPVSGKLAERASFYTILSDEGATPEKVTVDGKTYQKSAEVGAEKLFTFVAQKNAPVKTNIGEKAQTPSLKNLSNLVAPAIPVKPAVLGKENVMSYRSILFSVVLLIIAILSIGNKGKKHALVEELPVEEIIVSEPVVLAEEEKINEDEFRVEFQIRDADAVLLEAILTAGNLKVREGNKIYLHVTEEGKVAIPGNVPVKNAPKNIRDGLIQAYVKKVQ